MSVLAGSHDKKVLWLKGRMQASDDFMIMSAALRRHKLPTAYSYNGVDAEHVTDKQLRYQGLYRGVAFCSASASRLYFQTKNIQ